MGNRLGGRRHLVDDKYTRPQGLHQQIDVDHKKLRKLILDSKLAPCFPGCEDRGHDLEECPICFLYYPSLNRSRCCTKGICTECFLQMKTPNSSRPTQCPFCKTSNYAVEYRGVKSKEERGMEQIEEQRVIEARIRMRQQEIHDEEERIQERDRRISRSGSIKDDEADCISVSVASSGRLMQELPSMSSEPQIRQHHIDEDFDLDLEDVMVMEAVWRSVQRRGGSIAVQEPFSSTPSPPGSFACAVAALAERRHVAGGASSSSPPPTTNICAAKTSAPGVVVDSWAGSEYETLGSRIEPESFEERMMVAMVMSLAQVNTSGRSL